MFGLGENKYKYTIVMTIEGMMCGHCESHVADAIRKVENVEKVKVSHFKKTATVYSNVLLDKDVLKKAVDDTGYEVKEITQK